MANIETYLNKIRSAIFGEEVRGSIIDAISVINSESSQAQSNAAAAENQARASATAANTSAQKATQAATNSAKIDKMTVSASKLEAGNSPTVTITDDGTKKHLMFGIPNGATGPIGPQGPKGDTGGVSSVDGKTGAVTVTPHKLYSQYTDNDFLDYQGYSAPDASDSDRYAGFRAYKDGKPCGMVFIRGDGTMYIYDKDDANMAAVYTTRNLPPQTAAVNALMEGINDA